MHAPSRERNRMDRPIRLGRYHRPGTFARDYRIRDGIFECRVKGATALDALAYYAMPTDAERWGFTCDASKDTAAAFRGSMVASPATARRRCSMSNT
jgi:hypothetical protein